MGNQSASASASHRLPDASGGIRQSPLGLSVTEPTFGPSGMHERLNCCWKNRRHAKKKRNDERSSLTRC